MSNIIFFRQRRISLGLKKTNKAFTLVETLVAISIFSVSVLSLLSILASGVSETNYAKQKIVASYLAQEGIEYARNMRDTSVISAGDAQTGWNNFKDNPLNLTLIPSYSDSSFTRSITKTLVLGSSNEVKITSTVSWTQGSGHYNITFSENLFNWVE